MQDTAVAAGVDGDGDRDRDRDLFPPVLLMTIDDEKTRKKKMYEKYSHMSMIFQHYPHVT